MYKYYKKRYNIFVSLYIGIIKPLNISRRLDTLKCIHFISLDLIADDIFKFLLIETVTSSE